MQNVEQGTMVRDKWFHTYKEDGNILYQGHVLDYLPPQLVLVQLFSWLDGRPTCQKLLEVTNDWSFYNTQEAMHDAWDLHLETFHHITVFKEPKVKSKSHLETIRKWERERENPNGNIKDENFKRQILENS